MGEKDSESGWGGVQLECSVGEYACDWAALRCETGGHLQKNNPKLFAMVQVKTQNSHIHLLGPMSWWVVSVVSPHQALRSSVGVMVMSLEVRSNMSWAQAPL